MKWKAICLAAVILFSLTPVCNSQVKDYPKKPIQFIVGHQAGSTIDVFYRMLGEEVSRIWKVPVSAVNKVTASGSVAAGEVANSDKEGYTLFATLIGQLASVSVANPRVPSIFYAISNP
jgi:tripartite-type tricarboxylate transporter receptor subunit TctC